MPFVNTVEFVILEQKHIYFMNVNVETFYDWC